MADLINYKAFANNTFEVLTDEGFKDFRGILIGENSNKIVLKTTKGELTCTPKHKIMIDKENYKYAKELRIGNLIYDDNIIKEIVSKQNNDLVYELLDVKDTGRYYANNILSHQCLLIDELAFIQPNLAEEFWRSTIPVISSSKKAKIFAVSTANGTGNLFYELYSNAEKGTNGWHNERIDWWEFPGRDKKWKENTINTLGSKERFDIEFGNVFIEQGQSAIDSDLIEEYKANNKKPFIVLEDGSYKIYKEPIVNHVYTIGVDVSEGISQAASVIQIFDITDLTNIEQAAVYHNNKLDPHSFASKIFMIANQWGKPPLLIERNNCGGQVIDALIHNYQYTNLVDYIPDKKKIFDTRRGVYSHVNSRYKGIMNMRYWVNTLRSVKIWDIATIQELETFVRHPNGTWRKKPGDSNFDDRILAMVWGLFILETDVAEKYLEVVSQDEKGKPSKVQPLEIADKEHFKLDRTTEISKNEPLKVFLGVGPNTPTTNLDEEDLMSQGWTFL